MLRQLTPPVPHAMSTPCFATHQAGTQSRVSFTPRPVCISQGSNFTGGWGGGVTEGIAHTLSSCCFLLDFSLPCSLFHSNKWISPLVPCKASPPILRPLEISSFAISTHQGGAANRTSSLSGKRVHHLEPTDPLRDSDSRPSLHLPSTSSHVPTTSPLLLSLSCLACTARPSLFHPRGLCQLCM